MSWVAKQTDWSFAFAQVFGFSYQGLVVLEQSQLARRRVLDTLAGLLGRQSQGEKFSGRLSPTIDHQDPFGKGTLRVLTKSGGFAVYSLGPDGTDQGRPPLQSRSDFSNARPNIVAEYPGIRSSFQAD